MSRPDHATLEAAGFDAREALARPPAERPRRLTRFAAYASRLVPVTQPRHAEPPPVEEGRMLRARLQAAFDVELAAQEAERAAEIAAARRRNEEWLRGA